MDNKYSQDQSPAPEPKNEPSVENDYSNHTEITQPDPSTATPSIPQEIPIR